MISRFWIQVAVSILKPRMAHGGFRSKNGRYVTASEVKQPQIYSGYGHFLTDASARSGLAAVCYVISVAAGQSLWFYFGVEIFNWYYLSFPPSSHSQI
jgi:hypothetical protein